MSFMLPRVIFSPTGLRLALVQAAVLVAAFVVAGVGILTVTRASLVQEARVRISTEAHALAGLSLTDIREAVEQHEGLPGGVHYRLSSAAGRFLEGDPAVPLLKEGYTVQTVQGSKLVLFTARLKSGVLVSVGQTLDAIQAVLARLLQLLLVCGAVGAALGIGISLLLNADFVRRIDGVASAARAVSGGSLSDRAPERDRRKGHDYIDDLAAAFNGMLDEIERLIANVRQVSMDVAHDLRTPLTRVRQQLFVLRERAAQPDLLPLIGAIDTDLSGLLRTFEAMLRLAEIDSNRDTVRMSLVDLRELAIRVADAYRPDIEREGRKLTLDVEPCRVWADGDLLAQAIANLLENAMRHTQLGTAINLAVTPLGDHVVLTVSDNGPGVPPGEEQNILRRFYRLDRSRSNPGAGLGLALVQAIARRHGADLTVENQNPGLAVRMALAR